MPPMALSEGGFWTNEIVAIPGNDRKQMAENTWVTGVIAQVNFTPFLTINRDLVGFFLMKVYESSQHHE